MELLKMLSTNEFVAQVVNFLLLLFILRIFLWKRVLKLLDERKARISSEFQKAEDSQKQMAKLKAEYESQLKSIEEIARNKMLDAIKQGQQASDEIKEKAHNQANAIIESAKQEIQYQIAQAKTALKDQIVDLTLKATEQVLWEKVTADYDRRLVEKFLEKIDEVKPPH